MKIKRIIVNLLFNKRQREVIWAALLFSAHTYRRRGNMNGFAVVTRVIEELRGCLGFEERTWTNEEVEELIDKSSEAISKKIDHISKESYQQGVAHGRQEVLEHMIEGIRRDEEELEKYAEELRPFPGILVGVRRSSEGETFSKDKCESCENKEDCDLYNAVLKEEFEADDREEANADKTAEQEEKPSETADSEDNAGGEKEGN